MGIRVQQVIETIDEMRSLLAHWPEEPNPDDVHALRTTARKVDVAIKIFRPRHGTEAQRIGRSIRLLRKAAGKARDLDVFTQLVESQTARLTKSDRERLIVEIRNHRHEVIAELNRKVRKHRKSVMHRLLWRRQQIERAANQEDDLLHRNTAHAKKLLAKQLSKLRDMGSEEPAEAHSFRIRVKKVRDLLVLYDDSRKATLEQLGKAKDLLGEWHDWLEFEKFASSVLLSPANSAFINHLRRRTSTKLTKALRVAEQLKGMHWDDLFQVPQQMRKS